MALDKQDPQQNPDETLSKIFGFIEKLAPMVMGGGMGFAPPTSGMNIVTPTTIGIGGLFGAGIGGQPMFAPPGTQGMGFQGFPTSQSTFQNPNMFAVKNPMTGRNLNVRYNPKQDTYSVINPRTKRPVTFTKEQFEKRFGKSPEGQFAAWGYPGGFDAIRAGEDVVKMFKELKDIFGGGGGAQKQQTQQQGQQTSAQSQPASPQPEETGATKMGRGQELYNLVKDAVTEGLRSLKLKFDDDTVSVIA